MIVRVSAGMRMWDNLFFRFIRRIKKIRVHAAENYKTIPVIINNYNRFSCLRAQLAWLEKAGMKYIFIIDNHSDYKPLQNFYKHTKHTVFLLDKNSGFEALWKTVIFQYFKNDYYIYTDPDIVPMKECPLNAVSYFFDLLKKYPNAGKVGFGIKTDDLPDHYPLKAKVMAWEKQFMQEEIDQNVYESSIDTTFALYRPGVKGGSEIPALRTGGKYMARHTSWYIDPSAVPEDEAHYMKRAGSSASWMSELSGKERNIKY